jgi:hypothetical protein
MQTQWGVRQKVCCTTFIRTWMETNALPSILAYDADHRITIQERNSTLIYSSLDLETTSLNRQLRQKLRATRRAERLRERKRNAGCNKKGGGGWDKLGQQLKKSGSLIEYSLRCSWRLLREHFPPWELFLCCR